MVNLLALYADVAREDGTLAPVVDGGVWDQPSKVWMGLRIARGEYGRLREAQRKQDEAKRGHGRR